MIDPHCGYVSDRLRAIHRPGCALCPAPELNWTTITVAEVADMDLAAHRLECTSRDATVLLLCRQVRRLCAEVNRLRELTAPDWLG